ncbi:MAG: iron-sulfur cluster assembly accessory protein [Thermoguttaceae bacterium]|nr:iron-sulfur cluster assembly accessory protein [Thermoguttaceae bacterium]MBR0226170.1 iron-sulfur cluster assembly accessory protein [Thermoguttaceae bacterium]
MITLTKRAAQEVKSIMESQSLDPQTFVRAIIVGGGCSGMQYTLGFDTEYDSLVDARAETDGVFVVTEKKYALFLDGATIDFLDTETAKGFSIDNPKFPAGAGCAGCGH